MSSSPTLELLQEGLALHRRGAIVEAMARYTEVLRAEPENADALYYLGMMSCQDGRFAEGADFARKSLAADPRHARAHVLLGRALSALGEQEDALASFGRAIALAPDIAQAHASRADVLSDLGRKAEAIDSYDRALALAPDAVEDWFNRGLALHAIVRREEAVNSFDRAIACKPDFAQAHLRRANLLLELDRAEDALSDADKTLIIEPRLAEAWLCRGTILRHLKRYDDAFDAYDQALAVDAYLAGAWLGRGNTCFANKLYDDALAAYDKALELNFSMAEAWLGRGAVFLARKQHSDALAAYDRALAIDPELSEAWVGRCNTLNASARYDDALAAADKALAAQPDLAIAWLSRGNVFFKLKKFDDALADCDRALTAKPGLADAWMARGAVFIELKQYDKAFVAYDKALALDPDLDYVPGFRLHAKLHACNWFSVAADVAALLAMIRDDKPASVPLALLGTPATAADQLQCAKRTMADLPAFPSVWRGDTYSHDRIRLAYLSADLREHPVSYLMAGVFEHHDRSRFEVTALSLGEEDKSEFGVRLRRSFERFIELRSQSAEDIAAIIRGLEIDVLVDLSGFTQGGRPEIAARRSAPVQVNYLGYAGTMGSQHFDYIIADATVIPEEHFQFYGEKVVWLPDSFMAGDAARHIADRTPPRGELGLPETGFVFCCFNQSHKLDPAIFDIWMRLLKTVDGSVLWLRELGTTAADNLRREAAARGVTPDRLVFAPPVPPLADHLARHRQADLCLDTLHYNAHATASDSLWAGVPMVTRLGSTFAGRVGASLLRAAGLPELIAGSLEDYEDLAQKLAHDLSRLASIKTTLTRNRASCALFDTKTFTRHIESAYATMRHNHESGQAPANFAVEPAAARQRLGDKSQ